MFKYRDVIFAENEHVDTVIPTAKTFYKDLLVFSFIFLSFFIVEPICRANQQLVYGVSRNEKINITCLVDANPAADWFRWSFNNSMVHLKPLSNFTVIDGGSSVITYQPSFELQYGTLLCSSKNELGPQVVPCVFHVVSAGKITFFCLNIRMFHF